MIGWKLLVFAAGLVLLFTMPIVLVVFAALTVAAIAFLYAYGGILWLVYRKDRNP